MEVITLLSKLAYVNGRPALVPANQRVRQQSDRQYNQHRAQAKPEYLAFYRSAAWLHVREQALLRDDYLCQRCGLEATLVDHIVPSEDDWDNRLSLDNLESLCRDCHYWKTRRETIKRKKGSVRAMRINIVCGYPASGKTTYVRAHTGNHDLIYSYDDLMAALTGLPDHVHSMDAADYVDIFYELLIRKLKAEQTFETVWIIRTFPDDKLDSLLVNRDLHHLLIDTSRTVVEARLAKQNRLSDSMKQTLNNFDEAKANGKFSKFKIVNSKI